AFHGSLARATRRAAPDKEETLRPSGPAPPSAKEISSVVFLQVHAGIQAGHLVSVAVEHQCALLGGEDACPNPSLGSLAPAGMIFGGIHVGIEAVFLRGHAVPGLGR